MGQYTNRHGSAYPQEPGQRWAATDEEMSGKFPALVEFLTEQLTDEGVPRVTSTMLVSCEDGVWKLGLTDRAQVGGKFDYKLWVSGVSLQEALRAMDSQLQDGSAQWRKFPKWVADKRR